MPGLVTFILYLRHHIANMYYPQNHSQVRRLRIQQRLKNVELGIQKDEQENELPDFPSFIPFLPPLVILTIRVSCSSDLMTLFSFFSSLKFNSFAGLQEILV